MVAKLLLLMGPSGSGKSTLIKGLQERDTRFTYIRPFITRPLREGETDKIPVSDGELQNLWDGGALLVINDLFGVRYGTPGREIEEALKSGKFPVLDWPILHLEGMEKVFPRRLVRVYVRPPDVATLAQRLLGRNNYDQRLEAAVEELRRVDNREFQDIMDLTVITHQDTHADCVDRIYLVYKHAISKESAK